MIYNIVITSRKIIRNLKIENKYIVKLISSFIEGQ